MNKVLVHDALEEMYDTEYHFEIVVDNVQLYDSATVYTELCRYATYTYIDVAATITSFAARWGQWVTQQGHDLKCVYDALRQQYNPLNNYDMTETQAEGTARDTSTDTTTPTGTTTMTTNTDRWGYDSSAGVPTDQTTATQSYADYNVETEKAHDNTLTAGTLSGAYNETREHELSRSGNIGVTTSQQMLQSEIDLRQQDILATFCRRFIEKWCALI